MAKSLAKLQVVYSSKTLKPQAYMTARSGSTPTRHMNRMQKKKGGIASRKKKKANLEPKRSQ